MEQPGLIPGLDKPLKLKLQRGGVTNINKDPNINDYLLFLS